MGKDNKPQIVTIDNVEYDANNFNEEQITLFQHCIDLDRKIASTAFQLQQLTGGKEYFIGLLKKAVESQPAEAKEAA
jgi:hypothetical protein